MTFNTGLKQRTRGFTFLELIILLILMMAIVAMTLPTIGALSAGGMIEGSKANLRTLHVAHQMYSADHGGEQGTFVPHDFATYGQGLFQATSAYIGSTGGCIAQQEIGWSSYGTFWWLCHPVFIIPMTLDTPTGGHTLEGFGSFRIQNQQLINHYIDGRYYSPVYFAPRDAALLEAIPNCLENPYEFCVENPFKSYIVWSSYSLSPAAHFSPSIFGAPEGEFPQSTNALFQIDDAFHTPSFSQIKYPDLKTHMLEHHWLQNNAVGDCIPDPPPPLEGPLGCGPYLFNASIHSAPATLFYDGHIRLLPNTEVKAADELAKLWRRDTPWGANGYFQQFGVDGPDNPELSHHILTDGGPLGRDTLGPGGGQ